MKLKCIIGTAGLAVATAVTMLAPAAHAAAPRKDQKGVVSTNFARRARVVQPQHREVIGGVSMTVLQQFGRRTTVRPEVAVRPDAQGNLCVRVATTVPVKVSLDVSLNFVAEGATPVHRGPDARYRVGLNPATQTMLCWYGVRDPEFTTLQFAFIGHNRVETIGVNFAAGRSA